MGDENPIHTLRDYSKHSHEGYMNTIELPEGNSVVPLRSDTIWLVQIGCSFHGLWFENPNQHLKDFLKLVDLLDLDVANRERTRLRLFQFSLRDQASNWLERLPAGSISTWEDLTTRFLAQFFPPRRTAKLCNDILMFQQHQGESLSEAWTRLNEPPRQSSFTFCERVRPNPQPQALETSFEARIRDYMATHTERMERFENAIFKQREEINDRMAEMFRLLKELTSTRTSHAIRYYLKHKINEKLIEGLVENHRFNDSLSAARVGKMKLKTYNLLPRGPIYEAILKKKITKKEDIGGNFEIPYNIGGLKHMNALVDQGSDVDVMPLSTYEKLTNEKPAETNIRLFLASHSYIYPLGIATDVLVDVVGHVYPVDFVILNIKKDEKRPFILGTPFLTTAKVMIKFDKGTITLRSGKSKISFHMTPEPNCKIKKGIKNDIKPIAPTMTVNRLVLE
ncbi:zinc finger, CCHC-type containing protein [Tanacetum coccineum]